MGFIGHLKLWIFKEESPHFVEGQYVFKKRDEVASGI